MSEEFEPLTEALSPAIAEEAFQIRLRELGLSVDDLDLDKDVIVDTIHSASGLLRRYRLRKSLLDSCRPEDGRRADV